MKRAIATTKTEFESSTGRTPEYLAWHRVFKREFTAFLISKGATAIAIGNPNHFDMSGFFTMGTQAWYFRIEDLRWSKSDMLIRTAKSYRDYTGGRNESLPLDGSAEDFDDGFNTLMARYGFQQAYAS